MLYCNGAVPPCVLIVIVPFVFEQSAATGIMEEITGPAILEIVEVVVLIAPVASFTVIV